MPTDEDPLDETEDKRQAAAKRRGRAWLGAARARGAAVSRRGREWVDRQDPGSPTGVAIGAWRRYQAVDGPLQSALLSLYILVAIVPAVLVMEEYLDSHP